MAESIADVLAPWLIDDWQNLFARHTSGQMPHAVMLHGTAGIGKRLFSTNLIQALLCETSQALACGDCTACKLIKAGTHPDVRWLEPAVKEVAGGKSPVRETTIKVDAVRSLTDWLRLTPHFDRYRIAVVSPAESMTISAANALLKTLEEPASQCLVILLVSDIGRVPPTIRSRCQRIRLLVRDRQPTLDWMAGQLDQEPGPLLDLAQGGPLAAVEYATSDVKETRSKLLEAWTNILLGRASIALSVKSIADLPTGDILQVFASYVADTLKLVYDESANLRNEDARESLKTVKHAIKIEQWFTLYDQLQRLHRSDSASFKTQTVLEGIFADIRLKHIA